MPHDHERPPERVRSQRRPSLLPALCLLLLAACSSAPVPVPGASPGQSISAGALATGQPSPVASVHRPPPSDEAPGTSPSPGASDSPDGSPVPSPSPAGTLPATIDAALAGRLQAAVDDARQRVPVPGLSVAIRLPSGELWSGVSGLASLRPEREVTPDTVFAVASITKTFVTALILQLAEEGVLSLDDPLADYLPDFPRAGRITLRHLLSHTSGVFNFFEDPRYNRQVFADRGRRWTFEGILGFVRAPYCAPGACFHYSNTNFVLLGKVAEEATGQALATQLRARFFDPLDLEHTVFQPDEPTPRDAAHGHLAYGDGFIDQTGPGRVIPNLSAVTVAWAAGAIASTPTDLARWAAALYGGRVLSPESTAQMLTFRPRDAYGLGTRTAVFRGRVAVGHLGGIRGFENAMWHFPAEGLTIVVLSDRGMWRTDRVVIRLLRTLLGE